MSGTASEVLALLREWEAAEDPEPLVIETSGSTGRPKRVILSRSALRASARATHDRLGGPGQWVLNLPPAYVAGVQVLFRSVLAGVSPVLLEDSLAATRSHISGRSYISLVPTQLVRELREDGEWKVLTEFDAVLSGGGPLDPAVRAEAESRGITVVQTYGMSETCGGCVYDGRPLDGVEVRIDDGHVLLRGPVLFDGYEGEPERTAAAFDDGWLRTNDIGSYVDGVLQIEGRADDVIISGGVKVPAQAVAGMVTRHPAVHDAVVVGVPDDEWGERVVAVVAAGSSVTLAELRELVSPRSWAPRQVALVEEIPLLSNGKPDRLAAREVALRG